MKNTILLLFIIISNHVFSQIPDWSWAKSANGVGPELGKSIITDAFGNIYATGHFGSSSILIGGTTLNNSGLTGYDIFIVKLNTVGDILWVKGIGGDDNDEVEELKTDLYGNIYLTGYFSSTTVAFDNVILTNSGGGVSGNPYSDIFIAKLDSSGNAIWAQSAGTSNGDDESSSIAVDGNGNVYFTGSFFGSFINFENTTLNNTGIYYDFYVAKYNANGNFSWATNESGITNDYGKGVSLDGFGNLYVAGSFAGQYILIGGDTLFNSLYDPLNGQDDIFIAKYDTSGNNIWAQSFLGTGSEEVRFITNDLNGNIYFTGGYYNSSVIFGTVLLQPNDGHDMFITKMDTSGTILWAKSAGGIYDDVGNGITIDNNENVYLVGELYSPSTIFAGFNLAAGGFVTKYNNLGDVLWAIGISPPSGNVQVKAVTNDNLGNVYATGQHSTQETYFSNILLVSTGGQDLFIAKLGNNTIGIDESNSIKINIFPNPTATEITVSGYSPAYLKLCDAVGQTVAESKSNKLYVGNLSQGLYVLQLFDANGQQVKTEKVIVAK